MSIINGKIPTEFEDDYMKKKKCYYCIFYIAFAILLIIIITMLIFSLIFFNNKKEGVKQYSDKNVDDTNELDTISNDELNKARNSFIQFNYIDEVNKMNNLSYNISYNLYIPDNYVNEKKYPLILFIGDESTVGKDTKKVIYETIGGPIWATEKIQKENKCFVLVPQYKEIIFDAKLGELKSEYINITNRLINKIKNEYQIDSNKIYGVGQSMGGKAILHLLSNYQNLYTAGLIIDGFYEKNNILKLNKTYFTSIVFKENQKALNGQNKIKEYFNSSNISYGNVINVNYTNKVKILNIILNNIYKKNYQHNFITFNSGINNENKKKNNYKYAYRIEAIIDWLFSNNKVNCDLGYYYSENGKCISTTKKKVLLISNRNMGEILLNLLKKTSFIDVRIVSTYFIYEMSESILIQYDCVIYDLEDGGYWDLDAGKQGIIERYISNGGSFLVTHDHWDAKQGPLHLLGMERTMQINHLSNLSKVILNDHQIFNSYYDLTNWNIVNISFTHQYQHKVKDDKSNTAQVLMKFFVDNEFKYDYLVSNEYKDGRVVYWAAGHTKEISKDEEKLFINIVAWLTKYIQ